MKVSELVRRYRADMRSATYRKYALGVSGGLTAVLTALQIAAIPAAASPRHPLGPATVWDSVYTIAQAGRGESTYHAVCANCHGDSLAGINDAPALTGAWFHKSWDGNALSSLFNKINNDMPSDNPGTLTQPQVADVTAFLLKYNGYPAGNIELPAVVDSLATIRVTAKP